MIPCLVLGCDEPARKRVRVMGLGRHPSGRWVVTTGAVCSGHAAEVVDAWGGRPVDNFGRPIRVEVVAA